MKTTICNRVCVALLFGAVAVPISQADIIQGDDVIVEGSVCSSSTNFCSNLESFSSAGLIVEFKAKDPSPSIGFDDTDAGEADWVLVIDFPVNEAFQIRNTDTAVTTPFVIENGSPTNALYVDAAGRIGINTNVPNEELDIRSTLPVISLDDISTDAGRVDLQMSTNLFSIEGNAGQDIVQIDTRSAFSMRIDENANIGMGTTAPTGSIHVRRAGGVPASVVLESAASGARWEIKTNEVTGRLTFKDLNGSTTPFKFQPTAAENLFRVGVVDDTTVDINGNLVVTGNCTEQDGACADYVFEPDYELLSLDRLASFIADNKHLPNVPSAQDIKKNGVNMARFSGRLLEKIEELTLYTLQQQEIIDAQANRMEELQQANEQLMLLNERVAQLERAVQ